MDSYHTVELFTLASTRALHEHLSACMCIAIEYMYVDSFFYFFRLRKHLEKEQHAKMHIAFLFVLH